MLAYLVMSKGLHYLLGLTPGGVLNLPSFDTYLSYFTGMIIGFGIVFELPLVIVMLNLAGHPHPRAVPQVAAAADLRRLPDLRHREPEPRPEARCSSSAGSRSRWSRSPRSSCTSTTSAGPGATRYADLADDELSPVDAPEPVDVDSSLN